MYRIKVIINPPTVEVIGPQGTVVDFRKFGKGTVPRDMAVVVDNYKHQYLTNQVEYIDLSDWDNRGGEHEC